MKTLKRILGVFFLIITLIPFSFLLSACNNNSPEEETSIIVEINEPIKSEEEIPPEVPKENEEIDEKIYISSLSIPEKIYLYNNGVGINFPIEYLPENATENIIKNIQDKSIVNFASEISEENSGNLINFNSDENTL